MDAAQIAPAHRTPERAGIRAREPAAPVRPVGGGYYVARAHLLLPRTLWADLNLAEDDYDMDLEDGGGGGDDDYGKGRRELKRARDHWVRIK